MRCVAQPLFLHLSPPLGNPGVYNLGLRAGSATDETSVLFSHGLSEQHDVVHVDSTWSCQQAGRPNTQPMSCQRKVIPRRTRHLRTRADSERLVLPRPGPVGLRWSHAGAAPGLSLTTSVPTQSLSEHSLDVSTCVSRCK